MTFRVRIISAAIFVVGVALAVTNQRPLARMYLYSVGGLLASGGNDQPLDLKSARIIDLSSTDTSKFLLTGNDRDLTWLTRTHSGVAVWQPRQARFLVFPLCSVPDIESPCVLSMDPLELPRSTVKLQEAFPPGTHVTCGNYPVFEIDVKVSRAKAGVGEISLTSDVQGLIFDFTEGEQYLF